MRRPKILKTPGLLLLLAVVGFFVRIHSLSHDLDHGYVYHPDSPKQVGAFVATQSLSHDLEYGYVYHPDTPKQMVAASKYLQGNYFYRVGNLNYDGYPFFNSRLAAWSYQVISWPVNQFANHLGLSDPLMEPTLQTFFWITRFLNSFVSTLGILVSFFLARRLFGEPAGWLAALMVLLSPLELMASHTAMNDTTAAFFALLAVWLAVEIYHTKRLYLYGLYAIAFACGFLTKYHAALALVPLIICHLARFPKPRDWKTKAFWIPILVTGAAGIIAAAIAYPALALDTKGSIQLIIDFMGYTSNFGMSEEIQALSPPARWLFGLTHNLPSFREALTLPGLLLAPIGLLLFFRKRIDCWIAASMAIVYLLIALPFKPLAQPQYHTLVLPLFFVISAGTLAKLFSLPRRWKILSAPLSVALACIIFFGLFQRSDEVLFYYRLSNSRLIVERWMERNVPQSFRAAAGHYTLVKQPPVVENPDGRVMLSSSFRPHRAPENPDLTVTLNMHDEAFSSFRNPVITLYLHTTEWLTAPLNPSLLFWPAPAPNDHTVLFTDVHNFLQTPAMIEGTGPLKTRRVLFSETPQKKVRFWFRNGPMPNTLKVHAGSSTQKIRLAPWEQVADELPTGHSRLEPQENRFVYELEMETAQGGNFLWVVGEEQARTATYFIGNNLWRLSGDFSYASAATQLANSGVSDTYLKALPYQEIFAWDFQERFPEHIGWTSRSLFLTPGVYEIETKSEDNWTLLDAATGRELPLQASGQGRKLVTLPPGGRPVMVRTASEPSFDFSLRLQPNLSNSVQALSNFDFIKARSEETSSRFLPVRFNNGVALKGLRVTIQNQKLTLNPIWTLDPKLSDISSVAVWVHLKNGSGDIVAQFDHPLSLDLGLRTEEPLISSLYYDWSLPANLSLENAELHLGLYLPIRNKRIKVRSERPDVQNDGFIFPLKGQTP